MSTGLEQQAWQPAPSSQPTAEQQQVVSPAPVASQESVPSFGDYLAQQQATQPEPQTQTQGDGVSPPQPPVVDQAAQPEDPDGLRDTLRTMGYGTLADRYQTDEEALRGLVEAQSMVGRRNEEAAQWRAVQPYLQQIIAQRQEPAQAAQPQKPGAWDAPAYDPIWITQVRRGEDGKLEGPAEAIQGLERWRSWADRRGIDLLRDPEKTLGPVIEQIADRIAQQRIQQQFGNYQTQTETEQFIRDNSQWLFAGGNPQSGQLTPVGQQYAQYYLAATQQGAQHKFADDYAKRAVEADYNRSQVQQLTQRRVPAPTAKPNAGLMQQTPQVQAPSADNPEGLVKDDESLSSALRRFFGMGDAA